MIYTNKYNIPEPIANAVRNPNYNSGDCDYSVTTLLKPPRIVRLERQHQDELEMDVSDGLYALLGTGLHSLLDGHDTNAVTEQRLYMTLDGIRIGGQFDRLIVSDGILQDYKVASVWEYILGMKPEREQQLNIYAELCRQNGYEIKKLEVIFYFRNWEKSKSKDDNYPPIQVITSNVELWERGKVLEFILERIKIHSASKNELPLCTSEDRWARNTKEWAVMTKGRKNAVKLFEREEDARNHLQLDSNYFLEKRKLFYQRCNDYCGVKKFCTQNKENR